MEFNNIQEFKHNFAKIYHEKVLPQLKYIDNEKGYLRIYFYKIFYLNLY